MISIPVAILLVAGAALIAAIAMFCWVASFIVPPMR